MKTIGILILVIGLGLGAYALSLDVGIDVPARDFGYGVSTPAMRVANVDLMTQRQNYLIFSRILAVVGAILTGFASMLPVTRTPSTTQRDDPLPTLTIQTPKPSEPTSISICPKCRHMGDGNAADCARCGASLNA